MLFIELLLIVKSQIFSLNPNGKYVVFIDVFCVPLAYRKRNKKTSERRSVGERTVLRGTKGKDPANDSAWVSLRDERIYVLYSHVCTLLEKKIHDVITPYEPLLYNEPKSSCF